MKKIATVICTSCFFVGMVSNAWSKPLPPTKVPKVQAKAQPLPSPIPQNLPTSSVTGTFEGSFGSLETDAKGTITQLAIFDTHAKKFVAFDGCGAKARDLPQLLWSHHHVDTDNQRISLVLTIKTKGRCIDRIAVRRSYEFRWDIMLNQIYWQLDDLIDLLKEIRRKM